MGITLTINIPDIDAIIAKFESAPEDTAIAIQDALKTSAISAQSIARAEAPVKTGLMRNSIGYKVEGLRAVIAPTVDYALYVNEGTGIYGKNNAPITPSTASVFATKKNPGWGTPNASGYFIIGRSIKGQKANPFMTRAKTRVEPIVRDTFRAAIQGVTKEFKL